jgi:hypothetical protein
MDFNPMKEVGIQVHPVLHQFRANMLKIKGQAQVVINQKDKLFNRGNRHICEHLLKRGIKKLLKSTYKSRHYL